MLSCCRSQLKRLRKIKLAVLGLTGSGKRTLMKQMRIIYGTGYSYEEKRSLIWSIHDRVFNATLNMIRSMDEIGISCADSANKTKVGIIESAFAKGGSLFDNVYLEAVRDLWKECYNRGPQYELDASDVKYFLESLDRISAADYLPTLEDVLRLRDYSIGSEIHFNLQETIFKIGNVSRFNFRETRLDWDQNATAFLFLVALDEYDHVPDPDDMNVRGVKASMDLFGRIVSRHSLLNRPIILFLNKKDLFEEKIKCKHLADFFPDYKGPQGDAMAARQFILDMFVSKMDPDTNPHGMIYSHYSCALDTESIRSELNSVTDMVMQLNMREYEQLPDPSSKKRAPFWRRHFT